MPWPRKNPTVNPEPDTAAPIARTAKQMDPQQQMRHSMGALSRREPPCFCFRLQGKSADHPNRLPGTSDAP